MKRLFFSLLAAGLPALAAAEAPAAAPAGGGWLRMTLGLLLVLGLIGGLAWAVRRFAHVPLVGQGRLKVVGGLAMGARERVVLLQVGDRQILLGVAPGRIQTLHVLDEPLPVEEGAPPGGFAARLAAVMKSRRAP